MKKKELFYKSIRENFETFEIPKIVNFEKNIQTNTNLKKVNEKIILTGCSRGIGNQY